MSTFADYYEDSYPPVLWEAPPAPPAPPVGAAAERSALESPATVPDGTVAGAPGPDTQAATVVTADGTEHVGILPVIAELLTVAAGAPGDYIPALKASDRPRNVTELRQRAQPVAPFAWLPGQYVLVGENGKRAHWDGTTWQRGTVPDGTVGDA